MTNETANEAVAGEPPLVDEDGVATSTATQNNNNNNNNSDETTSKVVGAAIYNEKASIFQLFSFAHTRKTRFLIALGVMASIVSGSVFPSMAYLFARVFEDLSANAVSNDDFLEKVRNMAFTFMVLGSILFVAMTLQATLMETAAVHMTHAMQRDWFAALLRQDVAYHDIRDSTGEATLLTVNGNKYRKGVGRKLAGGIQYLITFFGGMAYSFYASYANSLIVLAMTPVMFLSALFLVQMNTSQSARANASYSKAGSIVANAVRSIRTISALNAIERVIDSYMDATLQAKNGAVQQVWLVGLATGCQMGSLVLSFLVVTLFGTSILYDNVQDTGCDPSSTVDGNDTCDPSSADILGSLFGVFIAASVLPQVSVAIEALTAAQLAAYPAIVAIRRTSGKDLPHTKEPVIVNRDDEEEKATETHHKLGRGETVDLPPFVIDSADKTKGLKPDSVTGHLVFQNVKFAFPTRPDQFVFKDFSLDIPANSTVALVGQSGAGKSTAIALLERFYDPQAGTITVDGNNLKDLNVRWLRQHIGLVSQEPKLFNQSIRENIALGAAGLDVTQEEIEEAARRANAHDFIMGFPDGYDTQVGDLGGQLSGGQRQRIAIARVLIKKPKILLLDEATSALDSESEATVQQALDALMQESSMTTFVIAHRLSTIRKADMIAVLENGQVVERGTHEELVANPHGVYRSLVEKQKLTAKRQSSLGSSIRGSVHPSEESEGLPTESEKDKNDFIRFEDVVFTYPARPETQVFRGLNLTVRRGETLALCGPSGQGKSTVIQLLERFYDPDRGRVLYNGEDIRTLNVKWWRNELGLVSQEPTLFDCSIRDNIAYGCSHNVPMEEIENAARLANAHDFIKSFSEGYDTIVGAESSLLISGGQKQRICIARALIKKPKVLLLDEATSALDSESEQIVQIALDSLMADKERTTIVIAHRLSTIRNADQIAVIDNGKVREIGSHDELMAQNGRYARMVNLQDLDLEARPVVVAKTAKKELALTDDPQAGAKAQDRETPDAVEKLDKQLDKANSSRARGLASEEKNYFFWGSVGAVFAGLVFPGWGIAFGYMVEVLYTAVFNCDDEFAESFGFSSCDSYYDNVAHDMQTKARRISFAYAGLTVSTLLRSTLLYWGFGNASERINKKVRDMAFNSVTRQEIGWFDLRSPGAIASQLSEDAALLHSFSGEPIRTLVLNSASVLVGVVVSFVYMWPFALLTLATIPFMGFGAEMEMAMYYGADEGDAEHMDEDSAGTIAIEALSNIRTIAALTLEEKKASEYAAALHNEEPLPIKGSLSKGVGAGAGQFIQMWGYALMFWWGGWLLSNYDTWSFLDYVVSMFALMFSLYGLAVAAEGAVNREKAMEAAKRIFDIADRKSQIDPLSEDGKTLG